MQTAMLEGGFSNPPHQSARAFRGIMNVMARPGTIETIAGATPPAPLSSAAGTVLLTLCDGDTTIYLAGAADCDDVRAWINFHIGARMTGPELADFAVGAWDDLMPLSRFPIGTSEYPDRSTTLIVDRPDLAQKGAVLTGPGIKETAELDLPDVAAFQANHGLFPLGLDFIFTSGDRVAALPRSTEVAACM